MGCSNGVCLWSFGKCPAGGAPALKVAVGGTHQTAWLSFLRTYHAGGPLTFIPCWSYGSKQNCMQPAGHAKHIAGVSVIKREHASVVCRQKNTANAKFHVLAAQHSKPSAVHAGPVISLAWHPNGSLLAAAVRNTPGFTIFDVSSGHSTPVAAGKLMSRRSRAIHCE